MRPHETLTNARDFSRARRRGRRVNRPAMTVYFSARDSATVSTRVGLSVPTGAGRAVARNRIKRRLRAAAMTALPRRGWDVVIVARPQLRGMNFQDIVGELEHTVPTSRDITP